MPWVELEPTIPASERPQTYVLDCATTGTGSFRYSAQNYAFPITPTGAACPPPVP